MLLLKDASVASEATVLSIHCSEVRAGSGWLGVIWDNSGETWERLGWPW